LHEAVQLLFAEPPSAPVCVRQRGRHGDRQEVRELALSEELNAWAQWPHLAQVGQCTYSCRRQGKVSRDTSYFITSLSPQQASPRQVLGLVRGHWGIENRLHWVRDVTFDEDRCQVRSGSAPQVMAALRNTVIGLFRLDGRRNIAAAVRTCAWHAEEAVALVTRRNWITQ
jgi:hypothetical protein